MSNTIELDVDALDDEFEARGWSDGLPVVAPTRARVDAMLRYCDRSPGLELGTMPPRHGIVTPEILAINAVMAGCRPECFPVVLAAVEAMLTPAFHLFAVQVDGHSNMSGMAWLQHDISDRSERFEQFHKQLKQILMGSCRHNDGEVRLGFRVVIGVMPEALSRHDLQIIGRTNGFREHEVAVLFYAQVGV